MCSNPNVISSNEINAAQAFGLYDNDQSAQEAMHVSKAGDWSKSLPVYRKKQAFASIRC